MPKVKPLKICCGKFHFSPNDPAFEVSDADAKELVADGAVEVIDKPTPKKEPKTSAKVSPKKE